MDRLNILVLHSLGNPAKAADFLEKHVYCLRRNLPDHNYLYHDVSLELPEYVKSTSFHAIILDVTLLCHRWTSSESFHRLKSNYDFVRQSDAIKIALPQDEYDCNELLDDWMCDWGVDVVVSVIEKHRDVLYPRYSKVGKIVLGYTSYVDESLLRFDLKPWTERRVEIGYRAKKLPPYFGRLGETKWRIGLAVEAAASGHGFVTDIVLGDQGTLLGQTWLDFINDSKFTLGANSGSSLLDPRGEIQRGIRAYFRKHPAASFEEIEEKFFKGLDGKYEFTAISPRILEAAALNSCQILVKGDYSGIVRPWEHYIPISADASDFDDVAAAMRDHDLVKRMIANCREAILESKELRYSVKAERLISFIVEGLDNKVLHSPVAPVEAAIRKYQAEMPRRYLRKWRSQAIKQSIRESLDGHPIALRAAKAGLELFRRLRPG
ncbi:MAG: hypothetical protein KIT59_12005 [Nitrosomonas sp.]|nr:hypothetical protein [Nitrosomonas sp.]